MATSRDGLARGLPSDVRAPADIGQVIQPPVKRSFWSTEIRLSTILKMIVPVIVPMLSATLIPMLFGWVPVMGRSMQPTLPCFGGYVKTIQAKHYKSGDIVCLNGQTLGHSVKRIAKVTSKGLYVRGDNINQSMDSSFGADARNPFKEVVIPFSEVKGKVIRIWSPQNAFRSLTAEGRFQNWVQFANTLDHVNRSPDGKAVVLQDGKQANLIIPPNRFPVFSKDGVFTGWIGSNEFTIVTNKNTRLIAVSITTGSERMVFTKVSSTGIMGCSPDTISFDGSIDIKIGDRIFFPKRKGITTTIVSVNRISCGCEGGIATIAGISPTIVPPPDPMGEEVEIKPL